MGYNLTALKGFNKVALPVLVKVGEVLDPDGGKKNKAIFTVHSLVSEIVMSARLVLEAVERNS